MKQNPLSRRTFLTLAGGAGASLLTVGLVGSTAGATTKRGVLHLPTTGFSTAHIKGSSNPRITVALSNGERVIHSKSMPAHPIDPEFLLPRGHSHRSELDISGIDPAPVGQHDHRTGDRLYPGCPYLTA